jgi:hypothetical protein
MRAFERPTIWYLLLVIAAVLLLAPYGGWDIFRLGGQRAVDNESVVQPQDSNAEPFLTKPKQVNIPAEARSATVSAQPILETKQGDTVGSDSRERLGSEGSESRLSDIEALLRGE